MNQEIKRQEEKNQSNGSKVEDKPFFKRKRHGPGA